MDRRTHLRAGWVAPQDGRLRAVGGMCYAATCGPEKGGMGVDMRNYFISYNSADEAFAQALSDAFERAGIPHFHAGRDLAPGANIATWMDRALAQSVRVLALCSPDYFKQDARYSEAERATAFWADPEGARARLIPVEIRDTAFPPLYAPIKRIVVTGMLRDAAVEQILKALAAGDQRRLHEGQRLADAHPAVFNVRRPRLAEFDGHFDALADLHTALSQGQNAAVTQAISGMGGIGKTTLAAEYAHRFGTQGRYGGVWWVDAETQLVQGLADLAAEWNKDTARTDRIAQDKNVVQQARTVRDWLGARPQPWLVIFDNVTNPDQVREWMPAGSARVILTSRFDDWSGLAHATELSVWGQDTTVDYLLRASGRSDRDGAGVLARVLGGLPLAADQAAAFLRQNVTFGFADYAAEIVEAVDIARLDANRGAYASEPRFADPREATVYATLVQSIETLPTATQDLMCLLSWLSSEGVELMLLTETAVSKHHAEMIPDPLRSALGGKLTCGPLIGAAARLSLLQIRGEGDDAVLIVHRLTQTVLCRWQVRTGRAGWDRHAANLIGSIFPDDPSEDPSVWSLSQMLLPHALTLAGHDLQSERDQGQERDQNRDQDQAEDWLGRLMTQAAAYLLALGERQQAIGLLEQGVQRARTLHGTEDRRYVTRLNNLSMLYTSEGRYQDAEAGLLRVLEIKENAPGGAASGTAATLHNLGELCFKQRQFQRAESYFRCVQRMNRADHGPDSAEVAKDINSLAVLYDTWADEPGQDHRRAEAQDLYLQALKLCRAARGERHPQVATYLQNQAILFSRQDRPGDAARIAARSAAIAVSLWGFDHRNANAHLGMLAKLRANAGIDPDQMTLVADLLPEILEVEMLMMDWVEQDPNDPKDRHFGPASFFVANPGLFEIAKELAGVDAP